MEIDQATYLTFFLAGVAALLTAGLQLTSVFSFEIFQLQRHHSSLNIRGIRKKYPTISILTFNSMQVFVALV